MNELWRNNKKSFNLVVLKLFLVFQVIPAIRPCYFFFFFLICGFEGCLDTASVKIPFRFWVSSHYESPSWKPKCTKKPERKQSQFSHTSSWNLISITSFSIRNLILMHVSTWKLWAFEMRFCPKNWCFISLFETDLTLKTKTIWSHLCLFWQMWAKH